MFFYNEIWPISRTAGNVVSIRDYKNFIVLLSSFSLIETGFLGVLLHYFRFYRAVNFVRATRSVCSASFYHEKV